LVDVNTATVVSSTPRYWLVDVNTATVVSVHLGTDW
jgi:hypothetical protein